MDLDYENIILISHEDRSRDLTRKSGDKISSIRPNLREKVANKVAGMVDLVARIVADDNDKSQLSLRKGRLNRLLQLCQFPHKRLRIFQK